MKRHTTFFSRGVGLALACSTIGAISVGLPPAAHAEPLVPPMQMFNILNGSPGPVEKWCSSAKGISMMKYMIPKILRLGPYAVTIEHIEVIRVGVMRVSMLKTLWTCHAILYWSNGMTEFGDFTLNSSPYGGFISYWNSGRRLPPGEWPWSGK